MRYSPNPICYTGRFLFVLGTVSLVMLLAIVASVWEGMP